MPRLSPLLLKSIRQNSPSFFPKVLTLFLISFLCVHPALAQKAPPYEERLLRLSEIIGSVHFLTLLCRPDDGILWHEKMQEMLDVEATTELRRAKLIERFNSGFVGFQATYRQCTPSAQTALNRYMSEAQGIVQTLTTDYSG